jgi:hypothetical protein
MPLPHGSTLRERYLIQGQLDEDGGVVYLATPNGPARPEGAPRKRFRSRAQSGIS